MTKELAKARSIAITSEEKYKVIRNQQSTSSVDFEEDLGEFAYHFLCFHCNRTSQSTDLLGGTTKVRIQASH